MHAYVYVDYNKDKEFDITLNADGNNEGELVSYTFYSEDGGADGTNSLGDQKKIMLEPMVLSTFHSAGKSFSRRLSHPFQN